MMHDVRNAGNTYCMCRTKVTVRLEDVVTRQNSEGDECVASGP